MRRLWAWVVRKRDLQVTRRQLVAVHGAGGRAAVEDNGRPVVRDLCNETVVKRQNMTSHQSSSPHLTRLRSFIAYLIASQHRLSSVCPFIIFQSTPTEFLVQQTKAVVLDEKILFQLFGTRWWLRHWHLPV